MRFFADFQTTRQTVPDPVALVAAVRAACGDPAAEAGGFLPRFMAVKGAVWTPAEVAATQTAIETCPDLTPQRQAQNEIDAWSISMKAFALALVDQINVLRQAAGLSTVTPAQALAAIRNKAATL